MNDELRPWKDPGLIDILGWINPCAVHCRMLTSVSDLYPTGFHQHSPSCDNQKYLHTLPNVLWGTKITLVE